MKYCLLPKFLPIALLFLISLSNVSLAQTIRKNDLIIKRDSTRIEALILEVEDKVIKYKRYSDQGGPTFSVGKKEIASIVYGNGEIENFPAEPEIYFDEVPITAPVPYRSDAPVKRLRGGAPQALDVDQLKFNYAFYLKKASKYKTMSVVGASLGVLMTVAGIVTISAAQRDYNATGYSSTAYENRVAGGALLVTVGLFGGTPLTVIGLINKNRYNKKARLTQEELRRRGDPLSSIRISPGYNPINRSAGLTLRMSF